MNNKPKTLLEIQQDALERYHVTINKNSKCYHRMHAHVWANPRMNIPARSICKWTPKKSIQATFDLFHEIGHIETTKRKMRRCESEYEATVFAIKLCDHYGLKVPQKTLDAYQEYIFDELDRGLRRGGKNYPRRKALMLPKMNESVEEYNLRKAKAKRPHTTIYASGICQGTEEAMEYLEEGHVVTVKTQWAKGSYRRDLLGAIFDDLNYEYNIAGKDSLRDLKWHESRPLSHEYTYWLED